MNEEMLEKVNSEADSNSDIVTDETIVEKQTKEKPSNKNICLVFFEALACCFIVFIHVNFPGDFGIIMKATGRFGGPFIFCCIRFLSF